MTLHHKPYDRRPIRHRWKHRLQGVAEMRLDVAIADRLPEVNRAQAQRLIALGAVSVNGLLISRAGVKPPAESDIEVCIPRDAGSGGTQEAPELPPILFRDEHLLVVDKPPGLVVHQGAAHRDDTLVAALQRNFEHIREVGDPKRPGIVHRIDKDTSGAMAVALSAEAYGRLVSDIKLGLVKRTYLALACGAVAPATGIIDAPIGRHPRQRTRQSVLSGGKPARTHYRTLGSYTGSTLLEIKLETGRTHQIRVHFAAIGRPIAGDPKYGGNRGLFKALGRQFLHAHKLDLPHPVTRKPVSCTSPLHPDLQEMLNNLSGGPPENGVQAAQ